jgi:PAS domain-containing protein
VLTILAAPSPSLPCPLLLVHSINKHKTAEMASEQRERELRDELAVLSDSSMVGLVRIDRSGSFKSANKIWFSIVKLDPSSPLDEWINNMHEDDFEWVMKEWSECVTPSTWLSCLGALTTLVLQSS